MIQGKAQTKCGSPLPKSRLFNGEGWSPMDLQSVRQQCRGIRRENFWDNWVPPSNGFYSTDPIPVQDHPTHWVGNQRGSVTIIGFFGQIEDRRYWVTRCNCGVFELINEKTLRTKPHSPTHLCALCRVLEKQRYFQECQDLCDQHKLDFETLRAEFTANRKTSGHGKRNSFGLIHHIRRAIKS